MLVFDGSTFTQTATLKTYNTPKSMAITFDRRFLLVGHDNSHYVAIYRSGDTGAAAVPSVWRQAIMRRQSLHRANRFWR